MSVHLIYQYTIWSHVGWDMLDESHNLFIDGLFLWKILAFDTARNKGKAFKSGKMQVEDLRQQTY